MTKFIDNTKKNNSKKHDANDDNNFTLFFGVKGSEFDEE